MTAARQLLTIIYMSTAATDLTTLTVAELHARYDDNRARNRFTGRPLSPADKAEHKAIVAELAAASPDNTQTGATRPTSPHPRQHRQLPSERWPPSPAAPPHRSAPTSRTSSPATRYPADR